LNITRWNKAAEQMFGWSSEEAIGKNTIEVLRTQIDADKRTAILQDISARSSPELAPTYAVISAGVFPRLSCLVAGSAVINALGSFSETRLLR
ncbi:MAG: PAS domain-containing protein, partial [Chitinophagaceae bacterium]